MNMIFKSVNIEDDILYHERISHYVPTTRSAPVVDAVVQSGATMIVAAYGSGKSLAASVGAVAVRNSADDQKFLTRITSSMNKVSQDTAKMIRNRQKSMSKGKVVLLNGFVRDVSAEICRLLKIEEQKSMQKTLAAISKMTEFDHVAIVWDEFGRHLENLVMEGRTSELDSVQKIAEWAVRASKPTASFSLLLHQTLLAYAENLNQTTKNEWRKIEGRFEQKHFVEDSLEYYGMLGNMISKRATDKPDSKFVRSISKGVVAEGWFDSIKSTKEAEELISKSWPLSAGALQVLPKLASRVGQNERTLIGFIESMDFDNSVGMNEVYLSFSDLIRSDVGVGGLHRKWVEAESARSKCDSDLELEIVSAAFLLQIGLSGERGHLKHSALTLAVQSKGIGQKDVKSAIADLISRKLILHRKLNDDITVWHGSDVDLAAKVSAEKLKFDSEFDLKHFLTEHHQTPIVRPIRHNLERGTSRYLTGQFIQVGDLENENEMDILDAPWGKIGFVVCDTAEEVKTAKTLGTRGFWGGGG